MILHFSRLMPYYRQMKFIQATRTYLEDSFVVQGKVSFVLPNLDIIFVYEKIDTAHRENLFYHLRGLMSYDPLMNMETFGKTDDIFMQVFDLKETDKQSHLQHELERLESTVVEFQKNHDRQTSAREKAVHDRDSLQGVVTSSDQLMHSTTHRHPAEEVARVGRLADRYRNLDISSLLQREFVIKHDPEALEKDVFAFSLLDPSMRKLMTHRDQRIDADDQLMNRYLGHVLQYRLLDFLNKSEDRKLQKDIAFEVHPELVLDVRFQRFDNKFVKGGQSRVILLFSLADIYSDYCLFCFARRYLRQKGYLLGLADVRYEALETIDLAALGMDYLFLRAEADWIFHMDSPDSLVRREIQEIGANRIVLTNCVQPGMVKFARESGITLMVGQAIREQFDRSLNSGDFHEGVGAKGLTSSESMRRRSRV